MSAKTGMAPTAQMASTVAKNVWAVVITSSPGPMPKARKARDRATVPLAHAAPWLAPRAASHCPALVLNADYTPLSYYPLSLWPWQTAVKAVFLERVDIVAEYVREVHSPTRTMQLPSVILAARPGSMRRRSRMESAS